MEQEDFVMGEDTIMASTELNGDHVVNTVDPSKITFQVNAPAAFSPKKDRLPIHPLGDSLRVSSVRKPIFDRYPSTHTSQQSSPEPNPIMDVTPSRSTAVQVLIPPAPRFPPLPYASSKTGLVYDPRMRFHAEAPDYLQNPNDIHPEDPRRIHEIFNEIQEAGLVQGPEDDEEDAKEEHCWRIEIRYATSAEICLIHTTEHYRFVESLQTLPAQELKDISDSHDSIYFNNATFDCAKLAAGGAIEACRAVVQGQVRNAIAIIRPPGHHAESNSPSGFCIFNNVPIATRVCQKDFPQECRKVLILDWDVHHGNGIQHAFYDDPNVLYISLHVFKGGNFYPNLPDADYNYCGEGPGLGRNVNIPWADHGMGDAEYIHAFQEVVMPIATEFDPDLVIISAGFDAAEGDVLGGCKVTPACYAHMTHMLMRLASGKIAVCLEGGYNLRSIARSALAVTRTLMLQPPDRLREDLEPPNESSVQTIQQVKRQQSKYWKSLHPKQVDTSDPSFQDTLRLHEIIRRFQSQTLAEEHRMTPLQIIKPGLAETFQDNVFATPFFDGEHPLLVIFHDPPSMRSTPDPVTGRTELHNTWLTDVPKRYVDWAVQNSFQVIDVNIPRIVSIEDDDGSYIRADSSEQRALQARELAFYLWDNYIEPFDATQVFFLGIGAAYLGLVDLLSNNENCTDPERNLVQCLIGFVSETSINSIRRATDDNIASWYYGHSLIFVQHSHHVWDPNRQRKLRKKWGRLIRSDKEALNDMLVEHQDQVQDYLLQKKSEHEARVEKARFANDKQQGLRSPPLPSGTQSPKLPEARQGSMPNNIQSPKMPPMGLFTVSTNSPRMSTNSPRSPRSPLRNDFPRR